MKKMLCIALSLVMLCSSVVTVFAASSEATANVQKKHLGLNTAFTHYRGDDGKFDNELDDPWILGTYTNAVRNTIDWYTVENTKGIYNFTSHDYWLDRYKDYDIDVTLILATGRHKGYNTEGTVFFSTQEEIDGFVNFAKAVVTRYPFIRAIEIWNEPNLGFTSISSDTATVDNKDEIITNYANMANAVAKAVREINPNIEIIAGAVANTASTYAIDEEDFINGILPKIYENIDAVSVHMYHQTHSADDGTPKACADRLEALVRQYGGWIKLYMTEVGWRTGYTDAVTEDVQARNIVKIMPILDEADYDGAYLYSYKNSGTDSNATNENWGLLNYDRTPKEAYSDYSTYMGTVGNGEYIGMVEEEDGRTRYLYATENGMVSVEWSSTESKASYTYPVGTERSSLAATAIGNSLTRFETEFEVLCKYAELEALKTAAAEITNLNTCQSLLEAVYQCGEDVATKYLNGEISSTNMEISDFLYELHRIAERIAAVMSVLDGTYEDISAEDFSNLINDFEALWKVMSTLEQGDGYTEKIYKYGREVLEKVVETEYEYDIQTVSGLTLTPRQGEMLNIRGNANPDELIAVKVEKSGEAVYLNTFQADRYGSYDFDISLPDGVGQFEISLMQEYLGAINFNVIKTVLDATANLYQAKKSAVSKIQSQYLLNYAVLISMAEGYSGLLANTGWHSDTDNIYASVNVSNRANESKSLSVILAGYDENGALQECIIDNINDMQGNKNEVKKLQIPTATNARVFVWESNQKPVEYVWNSKK